MVLILENRDHPNCSRCCFVIVSSFTRGENFEGGEVKKAFDASLLSIKVRHGVLARVLRYQCGGCYTLFTGCSSWIFSMLYHQCRRRTFSVTLLLQIFCSLLLLLVVMGLLLLFQLLHLLLSWQVGFEFRFQFATRMKLVVLEATVGKVEWLGK